MTTSANNDNNNDSVTTAVNTTTTTTNTTNTTTNATTDPSIATIPADNAAAAPAVANHPSNFYNNNNDNIDDDDENIIMDYYDLSPNDDNQNSKNKNNGKNNNNNNYYYNNKFNNHYQTQITMPEYIATALLTRILGQDAVQKNSNNGNIKLLIQNSKDTIQEHLTKLFELESEYEQIIFNLTNTLHEIQREMFDVKFLLFGPPKILPPPPPPPPVSPPQQQRQTPLYNYNCNQQQQYPDYSNTMTNYYHHHYHHRDNAAVIDDNDDDKDEEKDDHKDKHNHQYNSHNNNVGENHSIIMNNNNNNNNNDNNETVEETTDNDDEPTTKFQRTNENNRLAAIAAAALASGVEKCKKYKKRKKKKKTDNDQSANNNNDTKEEEEEEIDERRKRGPKRNPNCSLVCFKCAATIMIESGFKCPSLILPLHVNDPKTQHDFPNIYNRMKNENIENLNVIDYRDKDYWKQECKRHNIADSHRKMFMNQLRVHYTNVHHCEKLPEFIYFNCLFAFGQALHEVNERYKPYRNGEPSVLTAFTFRKYFLGRIPNANAVLVNAKKYALQPHEHKNVALNLINNYFHHVRNTPGSNVTFANETAFEQYPQIPYRIVDNDDGDGDETESDDGTYNNNIGHHSRPVAADEERERNDVLRWIE